MAYSPYNYGYQPPYYPQPVPDQLAQLRQNQQMQQPIMPPAQMPMLSQPQTLPPSPQNNGMIWVNGKAEADSYQVLSNSAVALWDANNPVVYLRQADSTGKPSTKVYDLVERTDHPPQHQTQPQIDFTQFVTWDKLDEILTERLKKPSRATKTKEDTDNG